jgi:acetyltransferase-like isoleucine patch superfamily enzyme
LVGASRRQTGPGNMNPIISPNIRVRYPDRFEVGEFSIVDDYCYFSTRVKIGFCSHVGNNCSIGGGPDRLFSLGDFSSLSAGVKVWCTSNDFSNDLVTIIPEDAGKIGDEPVTGDVIFERYTGAGANSVIMPDNIVPEGTTIGALSFVPPRFQFEPWSVYAGTPVQRLGPRNRERVLQQVALMRERLGKLAGKT